MQKSLLETDQASLLAQLQRANQRIEQVWPGESGQRQPVHTVYGGGHLFKADTVVKLGKLASRSLEEYAPDAATFAQAMGFSDGEGGSSPRNPPGRAEAVYDRVRAKLAREAVEDFRIDFEDGYGHRPDEEEDAHARRAALELAQGLDRGILSPFIGFRIKSFSSETAPRAIRTFDIFLSTLLPQAGGRLPPGFVVTLPKVTCAEQVGVLARLCGLMEEAWALEAGTLKLELMVETTQALIGVEGDIALPGLVKAADGRCVAVHFGAYDYLAGCGVTASHMDLIHPACDLARGLMQVALAGRGVWLVDGVTNTLPIPPHKATPEKPLSPQQLEENRRGVHRAWRLHFERVSWALSRGYYQGWDLHPAQLPARYAALYAFFLEGLEAAGTRLRHFLDKAAQATLVGDVFDDAATGQGLLNYFLRGGYCGALTPEEAAGAGLSESELRSRSFRAILQGRSAGKS